MTTLRPFTCNDLLKYNGVNLDPLTETVELNLSNEMLEKAMPSFQEKLWTSVQQEGYYHTDIFSKHNKYGLSFYMQYLAHWPEYFQVAESASGEIMGYIMGKSEGHGENWHGHVTALTVSPYYRRLGLAANLMTNLEMVSEKKRCYFVDLFVRVSNKNAISMYKALGYVVYRTVLDYYSGDPDENAYDMRKALTRDVEKKSVVPLEHKHIVRPEELESLN